MSCSVCHILQHAHTDTGSVATLHLPHTHTHTHTHSILCNMACTYRYWQCCQTPPSTHTVYYATWHAYTDTSSVATLHLPHTHTVYYATWHAHTDTNSVTTLHLPHTHTVYYATWHAHTDTGSVATLHLPHTHTHTHTHAHAQCTVQHGMHIQILAVLPHSTSHTHTHTHTHTQYTMQLGMHVQILAMLPHPIFSVTWSVSRGTVTLWPLCIFPEDSSPLLCDTVPVGEWFLTFQRYVVPLSSNVKKGLTR